MFFGKTTLQCMDFLKKLKENVRVNSYSLIIKRVLLLLGSAVLYSFTVDNYLCLLSSQGMGLCA